MRRWAALGVAILWIAIGPGHTAARAETASARPPVARIAVTNKGITYDGAAVTLDELKLKVADLKKRNGSVLYYREASNGQGDPPPQALEVIQLLLDTKLPIAMSAKPDFSDADDGEAATSKK